MPDDGDAGRAAAPARRWRARLALAFVLLVLLAAGLYWGSRPQQVARLALDRAGDALGLRITSTGRSEYRLRDGPMLVVRGLDVREPGAATAVLRADRALLSLPWSTVRSRGAALVVDRIELDAPVVDLAALQHWLASRPPSGPTRIPVLTDGLRITDARVDGSGWGVRELSLDLPSLHPQRAVRAHAAGRVEAGGTQLPFDLQLALTRPSATAGLGAVGALTVQTQDWRLPMQARLSARLRLDAEAPGLDRLRYGARARYVAGVSTVPFVIGLAGALRLRDGGLQAAPLGLALAGDGVVPTLHAAGHLAWSDGLAMALQGRLARWPAGWPALPDPLGRPAGPLPVALDYRGATDLSGIAALSLRHDATRFDARFRLPAVLDWMDAMDRGTPLPPLAGRLRTPRLEIAGARLEGVEIELSDSLDPAPTTP